MGVGLIPGCVLRDWGAIAGWWCYTWIELPQACADREGWWAVRLTLHACMLRGMLCLLSLSLVLQVGWCGALVAAGCLKPCCQQQLCGYLHSSTWLCLAQEHAGWVWQFLRVVSRCQMGAHATMACAHALTRSQARPIVDESIIYYQLVFVAWTAVMEYVGSCH